MNRNFKFALLTATIISLIACGDMNSDSEPEPADVLGAYLDSTVNTRLKEAYSYICSEDKAVKSLSQYIAENNNEDNTFAFIFASRTKHKILKVTQTGNRATANVEITLPDVGVMLQDVMAGAFTSAFSDISKDKKPMNELIAKKYENKEVPTSKSTRDFNLLKEKEGWRVCLDWKKEADQKRVIAETKKAYKDKIELYDVNAKYYKSYKSDKTPGVTFKLKNKGTRILNKVEVTVYFKDPKGVVISEDRFFPVRASKYSFTKNNKPLKPNYIWQMEANEFFSADSVPSEWEEGAVKAEISDIEFAQ